MFVGVFYYSDGIVFNETIHVSSGVILNKSGSMSKTSVKDDEQADEDNIESGNISSVVKENNLNKSTKIVSIPASVKNQIVGNNNAGVVGSAVVVKSRESYLNNNSNNNIIGTNSNSSIANLSISTSVTGVQKQEHDYHNESYPTGAINTAMSRALSIDNNRPNLESNQNGPSLKASLNPNPYGIPPIIPSVGGLFLSNTGQNNQSSMNLNNNRANVNATINPLLGINNFMNLSQASMRLGSVQLNNLSNLNNVTSLGNGNIRGVSDISSIGQLKHLNTSYDSLYFLLFCFVFNC